VHRSPDRPAAVAAAPPAGKCVNMKHAAPHAVRPLRSECGCASCCVDLPQPGAAKGPAVHWQLCCISPLPLHQSPPPSRILTPAFHVCDAGVASAASPTSHSPPSGACHDVDSPLPEEVAWGAARPAGAPAAAAPASAAALPTVPSPNQRWVGVFSARNILCAISFCPPPHRLLSARHKHAASRPC
jgi:hypothetical protein